MATQKIPGRAIKLGTDNAPDTIGDVAYFDGAAWQRLAIGTPGQQLTMNQAGTLPEWGYCFGGDSHGYTHGGTIPYSIAGHLSSYTDIIDKFSFATDSDATDVGNLNEGRSYMGGFHSTTHGYALSGQRGNYQEPNNWNGTRNIHKYPYASDGNATFVGDMVSPVGDDDRFCCGHVNAANTMGYATAFETANQTIQKISTVTDGNAVASAGTLEHPVRAASSACSASYGYVAGGARPPNNFSNHIQKFAFATDSDGTDVADLTQTMSSNTAGASSCTHGYTMGYGGGGTTDSDKIEKWSFATDANSTDIGNLTVAKGWGSGQSSKTDGYHSGGGYPHPGPGGVPLALPAMSAIIEKFPFASDSNATDSGDLTLARFGCAGTEY